MLAARNAERQENWFRAVLRWQDAVQADPEAPTLRLGLANALMRNGQTAHAVREAQGALSLDTTFVPAHRFLADYYSERKDFGRATWHLERVVRFAADGRAGWRLISIYRGLEENAEADKIIHLMAFHPESTPRDLLRWAQVANGLEMSDAAVVFYEAFLQRWPHHIEGIKRYGDFLADHGRLDEAETLYRNELEDPGPGSRVVAARLARLLFAQERWDEASAVMQGFPPASEEELQERKAWIVLLLKRQEYDIAEDHLDMLLAQHPEDDQLHALRGRLFLDRHQYPEAYDSFSRAAQRDSSLPALSGIVQALASLERPDEVERIARRMVALFPDNVEAMRYYGLALRDNGKFDEAVAALHEAVRKEPENPELLFNLASTLERGQRFNEASAIFERLLELDPNNPTVLNYYAYMNAERNADLDRAMNMVEHALAQAPANGAFLDTKGWVLYRLGRYDEAKAYLERALEAEGDDPVILDHLGDVSLALGDGDRALEFWRRALAEDPEMEQVRRKIVEHGGDPAVGSDD